MIRFDRTSVRVWVCGYRVHHFTIGVLLAASGLALMFHDRADWRDALLFR
jgi:hypothetical protein